MAKSQKQILERIEARDNFSRGLSEEERTSLLGTLGTWAAGLEWNILTTPIKLLFAPLLWVSRGGAWRVIGIMGLLLDLAFIIVLVGGVTGLW